MPSALVSFGVTRKSHSYLLPGDQENYKKKSFQWKKRKQGTYVSHLSCSAVGSVRLCYFHSEISPIGSGSECPVQPLVCDTVLKSRETLGGEAFLIQADHCRWAFESLTWFWFWFWPGLSTFWLVTLGRVIRVKKSRMTQQCVGTITEAMWTWRRPTGLD